MKNKYTKKNNKDREFSNKKSYEEDFFETDNLLERILSEERDLVDEKSDEDFKIDIIGMSSEEESAAEDIEVLDTLDDDMDDDMASRLSLYDSVDDDDEEDIKEFISRDYDVVAESRRRVNQPGKRKFDDDKPKKVKEKKVKEKKVKEKKVKEQNLETNNEFVEDVAKDVFAEKKPSAFKLWLLKMYSIYKQRTLQVLLEILGVLTIILIIVIIVLPKNVDDNDKKSGKSAEATSTFDKETENSSEENSTEKVITMADLKAESEESEVHKLVATFMDAEKFKCDAETAKTYLDNTDKYAISEYDKLQQRYIEKLQNIKCYKFDVISEDLYYVFVSYEIKYKNIETAAISGTAYIVKYDSTQSKYFIHNILESEKAELLIASNAPEVQVLSNDVVKRHNEALAKDEVLKEFLQILQGGGNTEGN